MAIKCTKGPKIYQYFPFLVHTSKVQPTWVFWYENLPSGNPGTNMIRPAVLMRLKIRFFPSKNSKKLRTNSKQTPIKLRTNSKKLQTNSKQTPKIRFFPPKIWKIFRSKATVDVLYFLARAGNQGCQIWYKIPKRGKMYLITTNYAKNVYKIKQKTVKWTKCP
jgi:hypothetical protein